MKTIENRRKVERNRRIGLYTSLVGLVVLVAGFMLSLPVDYTGVIHGSRADPSRLALAYGSLLGGLLLSQQGIHYSQRWFRASRLVDQLKRALTGLDDRYTLYHYITPVPHLLAGPGGLWVLVPQHQPGTITYENKRLRQTGVSFFSRFFAWEVAGRPELEAEAQLRALENYLRRAAPSEALPPVQAVLFFDHPEASLQVDGAPFAAVLVHDLPAFLAGCQAPPSAVGALSQLESLLPRHSIA